MRGGGEGGFGGGTRAANAVAASISLLRWWLGSGALQNSQPRHLQNRQWRGAFAARQKASQRAVPMASPLSPLLHTGGGGGDGGGGGVCAVSSASSPSRGGCQIGDMIGDVEDASAATLPSALTRAREMPPTLSRESLQVKPPEEEVSEIAIWRTQLARFEREMYSRLRTFGQGRHSIQRG